MNEKTIDIKIESTVYVNGVAVTDAVVIVEKTTVTIGELNVTLPNVSVS